MSNRDGGGYCRDCSPSSPNRRVWETRRISDRSGNDPYIYFAAIIYENASLIQPFFKTHNRTGKNNDSQNRESQILRPHNIHPHAFEENIPDDNQKKS